MTDTQQTDRFRVTVTGWPGTWLMLEGGETTAATTQEPDGGSDDYEILAGKPRHANIKLTRGYKADRDFPIQRQYRPLVGTWRTTVTVVPIDGDGIALVAETQTYHVKLAGLTPPSVNHRQETTPSDVVAEFGVERIS